MCAVFAARGRSGPQDRELHWTAPGKFAAMRSSPWLEAGPTSPLLLTKETGHQTKGPAPTRQKPTNSTPTPRRGTEGGGRRDGRHGPSKRGVEPREEPNKFRGQRTDTPRKEPKNERSEGETGKHQETQAQKDRRRRRKERGQRKRGRTEHRHRDTHTKEGKREPGGSSGQ